MTNDLNSLIYLNHYHKLIKEDYEKIEILKFFLPTEIAVKIVKMTFTYFTCCYCKKLVCRNHVAVDYEKYNISNKEPIILCSQCVRITIGYI
jgi:hypothetical protein